MFPLKMGEIKMKKLKRFLILVLSVLAISCFSVACSDGEGNKLSSSVNSTSSQTQSSLNTNEQNSSGESSSINNGDIGQANSSVNGQSSSIQEDSNSSSNEQNSSSQLQNSSSNREQDSSSNKNDNDSDSNENDSSSGSDENDNFNIESQLVFNSLLVDGTNVTGKVSGYITEFNFNNEVTVNGTRDFIVSADATGTKVIVSRKVNLNIGNNVCYVLEIEEYTPINVFKITLCRNNIYAVSFNTGENGSVVASQQVEEGDLAEKPQNPTRLGYDFVDWDYDFTNPITSEITINAIWEERTDTPYKIEYYFENKTLEKFEIDSSLTKNLKGKTNSVVYAEILEVENYVPQSTLASAIISADGSTVIKVYYKIYVEGESGIVFNSFTVEGQEVFGTYSFTHGIYSNEKEVDFNKEITVYGTRSFIVSTNANGTDVISSGKVFLENDKNTFYVFEMEGFTPIKTYKVTITLEYDTSKVVFTMPVENGIISKEYTDNTVVFNPTLGVYSSHLAIDITGAEGASVLCAYAGVVERIETSYMLGTVVTIYHGGGLKTVYSSLEIAENLSVGQILEAGDVLGIISTTNRQEYKEGAHLHFETYLDGVKVDPTDFLVLE